MSDVKRYRSPKTKEGQIKAQMGRVDGDVDKYIFFGKNVPRCDIALVMNTLFEKIMHFDFENWRPRFEPSLADELEKRGYDLDTFKFSIEKKAVSDEN